MSSPKTMPMAVWRWIGSIRLIGLLLAPLGRDLPPSLVEDTPTSATGAASSDGPAGYAGMSSTLDARQVVRRRAR
jgi:hypothetical protein